MGLYTSAVLLYGAKLNNTGLHHEALCQWSNGCEPSYMTPKLQKILDAEKELGVLIVSVSHFDEQTLYITRRHLYHRGDLTDFKHIEEEDCVAIQRFCECTGLTTGYSQLSQQYYLLTDIS